MERYIKKDFFGLKKTLRLINNIKIIVKYLKYLA